VTRLNASLPSKRLKPRSCALYNALSQEISGPLKAAVTTLLPRQVPAAEYHEAQEFLSLNDNTFLYLCQEYALASGKIEQSYFCPVAALASALHGAHACSQAHLVMNSDTAVDKPEKFSVGILAAQSSQVIACQIAWKVLIGLLPQASRDAFDQCKLTFATSPGIQGQTLMEAVLCMPFDCTEWTSFHVSPHRLCNMVSRHFHRLRLLHCYNQPADPWVQRLAKPLRNFLHHELTLVKNIRCLAATRTCVAFNKKSLEFGQVIGFFCKEKALGSRRLFTACTEHAIHG
jgi:hypothetical protein